MNLASHLVENRFGRAGPVRTVEEGKATKKEKEAPKAPPPFKAVSAMPQLQKRCKHHIWLILWVISSIWPIGHTS